MAKKRTKTDFTDLHERVRQARAYIAQRAQKRQELGKKASEPKSG